MKKRTLLFLMLLMLVCASSAHAFSLFPTAAAPCAPSVPVPLYCGPTQGFYRHEEQMIDLSAPFVCFGQYDCWTMVAQGTPEAFGPVGFIEGGLFDDAAAPALSFEESYAAMIEEDASVTNDPINADGAWSLTLPRGTQIVVLSEYGDWFYVQTEIDGKPARVFVPKNAF